MKENRKASLKKALSQLKSKNKLKRKKTKAIRDDSVAVVKSKQTSQSAYDDITVPPNFLQDCPLLMNLQSTLNSAKMIRFDMQVAIENKDPGIQTKKMTLSFNNDVANPIGFFSQKIPLLETYIQATNTLIAHIESKELTSTEILDYCDIVFKLEASNYNLNIGASSNLEEGPIIRLLTTTIESCFQFLDNLVDYSNSKST